MNVPTASPAPGVNTVPSGLQPAPLTPECLDTMRAALRHPTTENRHIRALVRSASAPQVALSLYLELIAIAVPYLEGRGAGGNTEVECVDCAFGPLERVGLMVVEDGLAWRCVSSRAALIAVGLRMDPSADELTLLRDTPRSLVRAGYEFVRWLSVR